MIDRGASRAVPPTTLAEYAAILWRRRLTVLAAIVAVPAVAVAFSSVQSAAYQARAEVLLRTENLTATLTGVPDLTAGQDPRRILDTQARLARVPEIARAAVERANVAISPDDFLAVSSVSADPSADLLTFSVETPSAQQAIALANAYAVAYVRYRAALDRRPVRSALASVRTRLERLVDTGATGTALYSSLEAQRRQLESILAFPSQSAIVVDRAETAPKTKPRPLRAGLLGVIAGILLGIALALGREAVEKRPRSTEALQQQLGLRTLGRVPQTPEGAAGLVALSHPDSLDAEVYRMLRLNFEHAAWQAGGRVFVVTSTVEGEGKSTVAANLSVALARTGRSVILVDADTLRPVLRERLQVGPSPDIVDVASGRASLEDALVEFRLPTIALSGDGLVGSPSSNGHAAAAGLPSGHAGDLALAEWPFVDSDGDGSLRVLASNAITVELSDYLVATKFDAVLAQLREEADIVILDAAPLTSSIGKGISELADGIVVVANLSVLRKPLVDQLADTLEEITTPTLGLVLTGVPVGTVYAYDYDAARYRGQAVEHAEPDSPAPDNIRGRWSSVS